MAKKMKPLVDKKIVAEILKGIEDKDAFIIDLISAINKSASENNPKILEECLAEWEASAELSSIQGFRKKVWSRFNSLCKAGVIK